MKHRTTVSIAAALLACALPLASAWPACQQQRPAPASANLAALQTHNDQEAQKQPEVKTFNGKISKNGQKLVLEDTSMNTSYQLDDQERASQYLGKTVRVTGTLDAESNLIHVQSIEAAV